MTVWKNPVKEPSLASRMYWDLARDTCPCCKQGEFPLTGKGEDTEHPYELPCLAYKIHTMARAHKRQPDKLDPFRKSVIMGKLHVWQPMTLAAILKRCDEEYWRDSLPFNRLTLSDTEYDRVTRRLKELAPDHPRLRVVGGAHVKMRRKR